MARYRLNDDNWPRKRKGKSGSNTGLILGLSIGGGVLVLAVVITVVVLASGNRNKSDDDADGTLSQVQKPKGERTSGNFESVDDPTVVDIIWPRLIGQWEPLDPNRGNIYVFRPDYVYQSISTVPGEKEVFTDPVVMIRDDSGTAGSKTNERYSLWYQEKRADRAVREGSTIIDVYPDGSLEINMWRYRKVK